MNDAGDWRRETHILLDAIVDALLLKGLSPIDAWASIYDYVLYADEEHFIEDFIDSALMTKGKEA